MEENQETANWIPFEQEETEEDDEDDREHKFLMFLWIKQERAMKKNGIKNMIST